jgi:hypothetical protein
LGNMVWINTSVFFGTAEFSGNVLSFWMVKFK